MAKPKTKEHQIARLEKQLKRYKGMSDMRKKRIDGEPILKLDEDPNSPNKVSNMTMTHAGRIRNKILSITGQMKSK